MNRGFATGIPVAQVRPSTAGTFETLAEGSSDAPRIEITRIVVSNTTGSAATFRLCHDIDGTTFDEASALFWDQSVPANETFEVVAQHVGGGIFVGKAGAVAFSSDTSNALTCTAYAVTAEVQGRAVEGAE